MKQKLKTFITNTQLSQISSETVFQNISDFSPSSNKTVFKNVAKTKSMPLSQGKLWNNFCMCSYSVFQYFNEKINQLSLFSMLNVKDFMMDILWIFQANK